MLYSLGDLRRYTASLAPATAPPGSDIPQGSVAGQTPAQPPDPASFPVTDLFVSLNARRLLGLTLDIGAAVPGRSVLVGRGRLGPIIPDDRSLCIDTTLAAVTGAALAGPGPVGVTDRSLIGIASDDGPPQVHPSGDSASATERFSDLAATDIAGRDGRLGSLDDILIDPETHAITHLVVDTGTIIGGRQLVVPIEKLDLAQGTKVLRLDLTAADLEKAPQIETLDGIDRHWIDAVRTYYQLPF